MVLFLLWQLGFFFFFFSNRACGTKTYISVFYTRMFKVAKKRLSAILPFPNTSAPARLRLPVPHVSTKPLKSSLSLHAKILFYIGNERIKYCKIESCGARFLEPRSRIAPLSFAPTRTGPKNSKFYGPDPGPTRLYFPRTGPDRNNLASTRN